MSKYAVMTQDVPDKCSYLTNNKKYEVIGGYEVLHHSIYQIMNDKGKLTNISKENCPHLDGGNWTLTLKVD